MPSLLEARRSPVLASTRDKVEVLAQRVLELASRPFSGTVQVHDLEPLMVCIEDTLIWYLKLTGTSWEGEIPPVFPGKPLGEEIRRVISEVMTIVDQTGTRELH